MAEPSNYGEFTSISGTDIHAVFGNYEFANLHMLKYAVSREKGQIYTLGSPTARATARGKRNIGGALVFSHLDRSGLAAQMQKAYGKDDQEHKIFLSKSEITNYNPTFAAKPEAIKALRAGGTLNNVGLIGKSTFEDFVTIASSKDNTGVSDFGETSIAYLADQLLPFDITLVGIPEYGARLAQRMVIKGVEIMSEASGTSIDDLVIEKQMSFIARSILDWTPLTTVAGGGSVPTA